MFAALCFSRSLRSTSFIASTRIGFSNLSPLGITTSYFQILHQEQNSNPVSPAARVSPSSFFVTVHPLIRFYSRESLSRKSKSVPNVIVTDGENPRDVGTGCQLSFTKKVCKLAGIQMCVSWTACSAFWFLCPVGGSHAVDPSFANAIGSHAVDPSFANAFVLLWIFSFAAHVAFTKQNPLNFVGSGLVNLSLNLLVGLISATVDGRTLLGSAVLTTVIAPSVIAYALRGVKRGHDFKYLNIILTASCVVYLPVLVVDPLPGSTHYIIGFVGGGLLWSVSLLLRSFLDARRLNDDYATSSTRLYVALMNLNYYCLKLM